MARDKYIAGTGDQDFDSAKTNLCVLKVIILVKCTNYNTMRNNPNYAMR